MKIGIVTSFNERLYKYYAHRFLKSYNLPFNLHIYHEGWTPEDFPLRDNIHYHNIMAGKNGNQLKKFIQRIKERNIPSTEEGRPDKIIQGANYKMDAIRFAYKVFAKTDLMLHETEKTNYDYVFWMDADIVFKKFFDAKVIVEKFLPSEYHISHIHRPTYYSECGFVGYNLRHWETKMFVKKFRHMYTSMSFAREEEWHDSYLFDVVRKKCEDVDGLKSFNLAPYIRKVGNPWPNTPMSEFMDHHKGKARKDAGEMLP